MTSPSTLYYKRYLCLGQDSSELSDGGGGGGGGGLSGGAIAAIVIASIAGVAIQAGACWVYRRGLGGPSPSSAGDA